MKLFKDILAVAGGAFFSLMFSKKIYDISNGWIENWFANDYGYFFAPFFLFLWFILVVIIIFAVCAYIIYTLETMIKIKLIDFFTR